MKLGKAVLAGAVLVLLTGGVAFGADWAQWRGPSRDGKSAETGLLKKWPAGGPELLWSVNGIGQGFTQAIVAGGRVYITGGIKGKGRCSVFDLDGKLKWKVEYGREWSRRFPGSRTMPTVHDGRAYVVSAYDVVTCFDAKTGDIVWQVDMTKRFGAKLLMWGNAESVLIDGDNVICTPGGRSVMMAALNRKTGETVWTAGGLKGSSSYCSPILIERGGTRLAVTITTHHVIGVEAGTGKLLWAHPYRNKRTNHPVSPVYAGGMIYCTSGYGKGGVMIELSADGKKVTQRWAEKRPDTRHGGVVLVDGYIYGSAQSRGGKWYCVELKSGKVMWDANIVRQGSVAVADGLFYCYGEKGKLALVEMSPKSHKVISSFQITKGRDQHWAHPSISDGRLYLRHGDVLMVYDIKAK